MVTIAALLILHTGTSSTISKLVKYMDLYLFNLSVDLSNIVTKTVHAFLPVFWLISNSSISVKVNPCPCNPFYNLLPGFSLRCICCLKSQVVHPRQKNYILRHLCYFKRSLFGTHYLPYLNMICPKYIHVCNNN